MAAMVNACSDDTMEMDEEHNPVTKFDAQPSPVSVARTPAPSRRLRTGTFHEPAPHARRRPARSRECEQHLEGRSQVGEKADWEDG